MSIKRTGNGWHVDARPNGKHGRRFRKTFSTQAEARAYVKFLISEASQNKDWVESPPDHRRLSELVELWFDAHGQFLRDGERRKTALLNICNALGNPVAKDLKAAQYTQYRKERANHKEKPISPKTCNNELGYINAVYNELSRTEVIDYANPLKAIRPIKLPENELVFLTDEQITELLDTIEANATNPHVLLIAKICLSTGARWGEAEKLRMRHILKGKITFVDTKSGRNRTVPINDELRGEIVRHGKGRDTLFSSSIGAFRRALAKTSLVLPKGQASHVLRHTFASHFIMNGGDILTLQKILGHSTVVMTMRYAHLSPEHLEDAVKYNPLGGQKVVSVAVGDTKLSLKSTTCVVEAAGFEPTSRDNKNNDLQ